MNRRRLIGAGLVALLIAGNAAVYWYQRQPAKNPPDRRQIIRRQILSDWDGLPSVPLAEATNALTRVIDSADPADEMARLAGGGRAIGFREIDEALRTDLIEAIGEAINAIGSATPEALVTYMDDRGLKPDRRLIAANLPPVDGGTPPRQLIAAWDQAGIDPHWEAVVPDAIAMNVYRPRSLRHVSLIFLGQTESWVWGNETIFPTIFGTRPTYEQVSRQKPALLADVRVLIEHDETLARERSPYFFRFWYAEDRKKWQPSVLKLVRTEENGEAPTLLF